MNNKKVGILCILGVLISILAPAALAEEPVSPAGETNANEPAWFPLLELGGAIIGIVALFIIYKNYVSMKGGAVGTGFKFITIAVLALTAGIIIRGLNENFGLMGEFNAELIFELLIYIALIVIAYGSKKSYDLMK